jgi:hypothetical protein
MRHTVICGMPSSKTIFHIILKKKGQAFREKKINTKCVSMLSKTFAWNISHCKENWARYDYECKPVLLILIMSDFDET